MSEQEKNSQKTKFQSFQEKTHEIIFEADTYYGKLFDVVLLIMILSSVLVVMMDSVPRLHDKYGIILYRIEWFFTILFSVEYIMRLLAVHKPIHYARSFFGIVDILSVLPTFLSLFITGTQVLVVIRALRLMRIFRIMGLYRFVNDSSKILSALRSSSRKIIVFLTFILLVVTILGTMLYLLESSINEGFNSIPKSVYWAIVTVTTVGYGDIAPVTGTGQFLAALAMILGYAVIAVPTGIISTEMFRENKNLKQSQTSCPNCGCEGHYRSAVHCYKCGSPLH
ncbi:ion transporter [Membranihabitans marinus]|uniref:ion transporter n=1 Tax=Membranihabitans marinus TaxID=1227546 RepID=UPI001F270E59|nr:ion transporter [Membranihabitans marinus]